jgi:hypothetical protein
MDKETIIEVLDNLNKDKIDNKSIQVIQEYCLEHNKPIDMTIQYLQVMQMIPNGIQGCLLDALDYYKNKFEIIELSKTDLKIPKGYNIIKYY